MPADAGASGGGCDDEEAKEEDGESGNPMPDNASGPSPDGGSSDKAKDTHHDYAGRPPVDASVGRIVFLAAGGAPFLVGVVKEVVEEEDDGEEEEEVGLQGGATLMTH